MGTRFPKGLCMSQDRLGGSGNDALISVADGNSEFSESYGRSLLLSLFSFPSIQFALPCKKEQIKQQKTNTTTTLLD